MKRQGACALGIVIALAPAAVHAQGKKRECARTSEAGQRDRSEGHLRDARQKLVQCAQDDCPDIVRHDCLAWIDEIDRLMPTVVFVVHDVRGEDARSPRVLVDGDAVEASGKAIPIDPGRHVVRAELVDGSAATKEVTIAEAVKGRVIVLDAVAKEAASPRDVREMRTTTNDAAPPVLGYVLVGAGVLLGGLTGYLWLDGKSHEDDLRSSCSPSCSKDEVDGLRTQYRISYVTAGASVIALGAGIYFWFFAPRSNVKATAEGLRLRF